MSDASDTDRSPPGDAPPPEPMRRILLGSVTAGALLVRVPGGRLVVTLLGDAKSVILSADDATKLREWLGEPAP